MVEPNTTYIYCKDTRHKENNCICLNNKIAHKLQAQEQVTANKAIMKKVQVLTYQKIMAPQILNQSEGGKVCSPDWIDQTNYGKEMVELIKKISSQQVSAQIKIKAMQRVVATCPRVNMGCGRKRILSLLDPGSPVTLIHQSFLSRKSCPLFNHLMGRRQRHISCFS